MGARLGEMEKSSSRTCRGHLWGRGCSEAAGPWRVRGGGGAVQRRRCSGGLGGDGGVGELHGGAVKPSGGSVVVEEGCGAPATAS